MIFQKPLMSFDYAIKYLLKDKGDFSIVEGFISALLKTQGYGNVKIIGLVDPESNKEDPKDKRSIADVIVEDENKNKYIIEIERNVKDSFIHKACFNTARLTVDSLAQREDYLEIVKIFHISLLYFTVGKGAIYHGKTIIHEIHTHEKLSVTLTDKETKKTFESTDIFPEFFFISVPGFNEKLEEEMDDWLYVLKHDDVPKTFHSSYMNQVAEKLSILKMSKSERREYSSYLKKIYNDRDELNAAEGRGIEKGIEKGKEEGIAIGVEKGLNEGKILVAKNLLSAGVEEAVILNATSLSLEELREIKESK